MKGWGRSCFWLGFGVWLVSGCGGRTGALGGDIYGDDDDSTSGASPGAGGSAGASNKGGANGRGGARPGGGSAPVAGAGGATYGGAGPVAGYGGGAAAGGFGTSGFGAGGFGGTGFAGFPGGGFAGFGGNGAGGNVSVDCQSCLANACAPELVQCFQDFGCVSIFGCLATTGCSGAQCYTPKYCKNTIDMFGGPAGPAMKDLLLVFTCGFNSGCQCP
jgi:hypothetical protein